LARHRPVRIDRGTVFDLLARQVDGENLSIVVQMPESMGREQDLAPGQPCACVCRKVADGPGLVVKIEIFNVANCAVGSGEFMAANLF